MQCERICIRRTFGRAIALRDRRAWRGEGRSVGRLYTAAREISPYRSIRTLVRAIAGEKYNGRARTFNDPAALFAPRVARSFSHLFALKSEICLKFAIDSCARRTFVGFKRREPVHTGRPFRRNPPDKKQLPIFLSQRVNGSRIFE